MAGCLTACVSAPWAQEAAAKDAVPANIAATETDYDSTFAFMLESVRLEILIERAFAGAGLSAPLVLADGPVSAAPDGTEVNDAARIGEMRAAAINALNNSAFALVALRNSMCAQDLVPVSACGALILPPPAHQGQALPEIQAIGRDLWARADPFVKEGCRRGIQETQDPLFCSVE